MNFNGLHGIISQKIELLKMLYYYKYKMYSDMWLYVICSIFSNVSEASCSLNYHPCCFWGGSNMAHSSFISVLFSLILGNIFCVKVGAKISSETSVTVYWITRRPIPEDRNL
jgi:hypothetical protein